MKKIYLSIIAIVLLHSVKAQITDNNLNQSFKIGEFDFTSQKSSTYNKHEKALGQEIWSDDFSDPSTWDIDNSGQTAADKGWNINATADGWVFKSPSSYGVTDNFAELLNGDPNTSTQALNVTYNLTTKNPIDIALKSASKGKNVSLTFSQYGARFNDAQNVSISMDGGTTWVLVGGNSDVPITTTTSNNLFKNTKTINLAPFLTGSFNSVKIKFSWTTAYPSSASNANVWIAYGWIIDDVKIVTNADNDLIQNKVLFGSIGAYADKQGDMGYYKIPTTQISPIDFGGVITNDGSSEQSDIVFNANATGYAGVSAPASIAPGVKDTVWVANKYVHDGTIGSKTFNFNTSSSAIDDAPSNNATSPITINFTDHTYARDNGIKDGIYDNSGKAYELANVYDVFADQTLYSIDAFIDVTTAINTSIYGIIYQITQAGEYVELDRSDEIVVTSSMRGKIINLELSNPQLLNANQPYVIGVGSAGGNGVDLVVGTAGKANKYTSWIKDDGKWFYISTTPMIRMNFQNATGLTELQSVSSLNIYPNPANTSANVSFELNNETDVNIAVLDLTGKTIYSNKLGNMNSGSHNVTINTDTLSNGIYVVNFEANGTTTSQKLVVKK